MAKSMMLLPISEWGEHMKEVATLEVVKKGDDDNMVLKTYEENAFPVDEFFKAWHLFRDNPEVLGLMLRVKLINSEGETYSESDVFIEF